MVLTSLKCLITILPTKFETALEEEMLCPFHYYGVTDLTINGEEIDDQTEFNKLFAKERVDHILLMQSDTDVTMVK